MTLVPPPSFLDDLQRLGVELPQPMLDQLGDYLHALLEVNQTTNLTAIREPEQAWQRLILDSLTLLFALEDLPEGAVVADLGSGGGLPGVPLAICRPDLQVWLIESRGRKASFLEQVVAQLGLGHVNVFTERAETLARNPACRQKVDAVVSRAIGPMAQVLEWSMPLARVGGRVLAMKGPKVQEELRDCGDVLEALGGGEIVILDAYPESFDNQLVIVRVDKARSVAAVPDRVEQKKSKKVRVHGKRRPAGRKRR